MLAEPHREAGNLAAAVNVIEQLEPSTITAVSLVTFAPDAGSSSAAEAGQAEECGSAAGRYKGRYHQGRYAAAQAVEFVKQATSDPG